MIQLLDLHKQFLRAHIVTGGTVADFTMGNGHDTLFLAQSVGDNGHVYAFDIQKEALDHTRTLLEENNVIDRVTLIHDSHAKAADYIKEPICAGVFNLGWLPGSGDKSITTKRESTRAAVGAAVELLGAGGILLIAVYPGHEEGRLEGLMLHDMLSELSRFVFSVTQIQIINSPTSPFFIMVEKKEGQETK